MPFKIIMGVTFPALYNRYSQSYYQFAWWVPCLAGYHTLINYSEKTGGLQQFSHISV